MPKLLNKTNLFSLILASLLIFLLVSNSINEQIPPASNIIQTFSNSGSTSQNPNSDQTYSSQPKIVLGYCPTMSAHAKTLAQNNPQIVLLEHEDSAQVLLNLKNSKINVALIGRVAKSWEVENVSSLKLSNGSTLIYPQKSFIPYSQLEQLTIHTYLPSSAARELFSPSQKLVFHSSLQSALSSASQAEPILINWDDYQDEFELMVPYDSQGKIKSFRIPILYSSTYNLTHLVLSGI